MATARPRNLRATALVEIGITVVFVALVVWFVWLAPPVTVPAAASPGVPSADLSTAPLRHVPVDEPVVKIGGFERTCVDCHGLFESNAETARNLVQHQEIVLDHGLNDRCFNCHDRTDRNMLALRGDERIPFTEVARLCAKCHGPTYRDWQKGMHGRTMSRWDPASPEHRRLRCSECHDPHAPALDALRPLPGPNTLRMGDRIDPGHGGAVELIDPLRKWQHVEEHVEEDVEEHVEEDVEEHVEEDVEEDVEETDHESNDEVGDAAGDESAGEPEAPAGEGTP